MYGMYPLIEHQRGFSHLFSYYRLAIHFLGTNYALKLLPSLFQYPIQGWIAEKYLFNIENIIKKREELTSTELFHPIIAELAGINSTPTVCLLCRCTGSLCYKLVLNLSFKVIKYPAKQHIFTNDVI